MFWRNSLEYTLRYQMINHLFVNILSTTISDYSLDFLLKLAFNVHDPILDFWKGITLFTKEVNPRKLREIVDEA